MDEALRSFLVPAFFTHTAAAVLVLAWWFTRNGGDRATFRYFGCGLVGYGLGLIAWSLVVIVKPDDLVPWILGGVIPFLLGNIGFAKSASAAPETVRVSPLMILTIAFIIVTFVMRTVLYESEPYISDEGLLYFGLQPVPIALYIGTIAVSFLPAIWKVVPAFASEQLRRLMAICLNAFFICAIVLVSASEHSLLVINGFVLSIAAILAWVQAVRNWKVMSSGPEDRASGATQN